MNIEKHLFTKTINERAVEQQKSFLERRAGRGCSGCCGAGGVIVFEKPSSLSF